MFPVKHQRLSTRRLSATSSMALRPVRILLQNSVTAIPRITPRRRVMLPTPRNTRSWKWKHRHSKKLLLLPRYDSTTCAVLAVVTRRMLNWRNGRSKSNSIARLIKSTRNGLTSTTILPRHSKRPRTIRSMQVSRIRTKSERTFHGLLTRLPPTRAMTLPVASTR